MDRSSASEAAALTVSWGDLPPGARARALANLVAWVVTTLRPGWPVQCERLLSCFPAHADITLDLRGLKILWEAAAIPEISKTGEVGRARVERLLSWTREELEPAMGRWIASGSGCRGGACEQADPPAGTAEDEESWGVRCRTAAAVAAGTKLPEPPPLIEPWEIAAARAERAKDGPSGEDPSGIENLGSLEAAGPPAEPQW